MQIGLDQERNLQLLGVRAFLKKVDERARKDNNASIELLKYLRAGKLGPSRLLLEKATVGAEIEQIAVITTRTAQELLDTNRELANNSDLGQAFVPLDGPFEFSLQRMPEYEFQPDLSELIEKQALEKSRRAILLALDDGKERLTNIASMSQTEARREAEREVKNQGSTILFFPSSVLGVNLLISYLEGESPARFLHLPQFYTLQALQNRRVVFADL